MKHLVTIHPIKLSVTLLSLNLLDTQIPPYLMHQRAETSNNPFLLGSGDGEQHTRWYAFRRH